MEAFNTNDIRRDFEELPLKTEIQKGIDDIAAGNVIDGETVFAALRKHINDEAS